VGVLAKHAFFTNKQTFFCWALAVPPPVLHALSVHFFAAFVQSLRTVAQPTVACGRTVDPVAWRTTLRVAYCGFVNRAGWTTLCALLAALARVRRAGGLGQAAAGMYCGSGGDNSSAGAALRRARDAMLFFSCDALVARFRQFTSAGTWACMKYV